MSSSPALAMCVLASFSLANTSQVWVILLVIPIAVMLLSFCQKHEYEPSFV